MYIANIGSFHTIYLQHYDLSNDLFKTFLDKDHMMYSSAIFKTRLVETPCTTIGGGMSKVSLEFVDTLEEAQELCFTKGEKVREGTQHCTALYCTVLQSSALYFIHETALH